jgi:hypothetical protein
MKVKDYWQIVRDRADDLGSDGCTMATSAFRDCCLRHDLEFRTGRSAVSRRPLTRAEADARFLACMQSRSALGWFSPMAWIRYAAVRMFGQRHWKGRG